MSEPGSGSDAFSLSTTAQSTGSGLRAQRLQDVRHERARERPLPRLRHDRQGARLRRGHGVPRRAGDARADRREAALEDGPAHLADERALLRRLRGARGERCSASRAAGCSCSTRRCRGSAAASSRARSGRCSGSSSARSPTRRSGEQFGQPIGSFQAVSHKLVDMKLRLETARLLLYRLGWLIDRGQKPPALDSALVKLYLSECYVRSSLDALQIHGGYGYMTEYELEREVRDAIGSRSTRDVRDPVQHRRAEHGAVTAETRRTTCSATRQPRIRRPSRWSTASGAITYAELDGAVEPARAPAARSRRRARRPRRPLPREVARGVARDLRDPESRRHLRAARPGGARRRGWPRSRANADLRILLTRAEKAELWPRLVDEGAPVETLVVLNAKPARPPARRASVGHPRLEPAQRTRHRRPRPRATSSTPRARRACRRA